MNGRITLNIGFSGTRKGMTPDQAASINRLLFRIKKYNPNVECWLNHGDCTGADEQVHSLAKGLGYKIRLYPPDNVKQRAYCQEADETEVPAMYSVRNGNIVRASDFVITAPYGKAEILRGSGTWQVVRLVRKIRPKKPYVTVFPDGEQQGGNEWQKFIH